MEHEFNLSLELCGPASVADRLCELDSDALAREAVRALVNGTKTSLADLGPHNILIRDVASLCDGCEWSPSLSHAAPMGNH